MGDQGVRGTVTPLSEAISVQHAENVAKKVAEAIESQMQQLQTLQGFDDDNRSLTKLLLELPDRVSYNIMVPFGKAAFMPGRLIHTNELLVLLGEGYYAERSAKQAAEILTRRSNFLQTKIDAVQEHIKDLEAEASFAKETAAEAASGVVEIREDYREKPAVETTNTMNDIATTPSKQDDSDDEHARIMARLAELELAEEAAGDEEDEEEDDDAEETLGDFRAALRRSRHEDLDEPEDEGDDEGEDEDYEDEDSEEVDEDDSTAANTFLNRMSEVEGQGFQSSILQSQGQGFQSSILPSQGQGFQSSILPSQGQGFQSSILPSQGQGFQSSILPSQGQGFQSSILPSQGQGFQSSISPTQIPARPSQKPNVGEQRRVTFSEVDNVTKPSASEARPPRDINASPAQRRAFTGSVVERNTEHLAPASAPVAPEAPPSRPVSKFKQRKG